MPDDETYRGDETAPIAGTPYVLHPTVAPTTPFPAAAPPPPAPVVITPAGWYPSNGEQRYWDGHAWTEHRAPAAVPVYRPAYITPVIVTDARTNGAEVAVAWVVTVLTAFYMLPWAIAATRGKSNSVAVALVNFFLGWTFIGWIVALVMACTAHRVAYVHHRG